MAPRIERLAVPPTMLGEGPHWDSARRALFFVDFFKSTIYKYMPDVKQFTKTTIEPDRGTLIIPVTDSPDLFLFNEGRKVEIIRWDGQNDSKVEVVKVLAELDSAYPANIANDAKVDSQNRLYTGTVGVDTALDSDTEDFRCLPTGSLYCVTADGQVKTYDTGVSASNGIAIDERRGALYHVDTYVNLIRKFDYDLDTGNLSNKTSFFEYKPSTKAYLDGMTLDRDGNLWVASYGGGCVLNISGDTGEVIQTIEMPDKDVTSVCFGGDNLDILYVTTAYDLKYVGDNPDGGGTYAVYDLGVKGFENIPFDFNI